MSSEFDVKNFLFSCAHASTYCKQITTKEMEFKKLFSGIGAECWADDQVNSDITQ